MRDRNNFAASNMRASIIKPSSHFYPVLHILTQTHTPLFLHFVVSYKLQLQSVVTVLWQFHCCLVELVGIMETRKPEDSLHYQLFLTKSKMKTNKIKNVDGVTAV